ncbi:hypothetical protein Q7P37_005383 [Cladosporium fusiforme]
MGGKRKRAEQTYSKKHSHANNPCRAGSTHDFFSHDNDGPDYSISSLFRQPRQLYQSNPPKSSSLSTLSAPANKPTPRITPAMTTEPSDNDIETLIAFTGCSKDDSIRYLKAKNNNVESAMNALLDGEDISKQEAAAQWDESPWHTDRDGNANVGERNLRPLGTGTSTAPTRVPSPAGDLKAPTSKDTEDADLARALEMSQQDAGMTYQQESGVVSADGTSRQTFGPATKDQYEKNDWAIVPFSLGASSEIVPDVEPEQRKNVDGEPRFLKNLPSGDYLPNFLTIAHAIPAVREALLLRNCTMTHYGEDAEWWKGNPIALPKIVHTEDGAPANAEIDRFDEFIAETQRLMAALDCSQRSYASVHALSQTEFLHSGESPSLIERFIERIIDTGNARCGQEEEYLSLFATNITTSSPEGLTTPYLKVFDMPVTPVGEDKLGLMEILDGLLWDTTSEDATSYDNSIIRGADVLVMCAKQTNPAAEKLQIDVPPTLYLDKYFTHNLDISKPARLKIIQQKQHVAKITEIENKLTKWEHPQKRGEDLDARALMQHTLGHFSGKNMADATNADRENGIVVNGTSTPEQPHYAEIAAKLEAIALSVDKKLERLAAQKEAIQKNISKLSNSSPPALEARGLTQRYTLMGVATKPSITYVLRRKEDEDDDDRMSTEEDHDDDDSTPAGMQWWRIEYAVNSNTPRIHKSKVAEYEVLHAVEVEHSAALLVYASDRAVDDSLSQPLPQSLQQFIQTDDEHFLSELHDATIARPPPAYDYAHADSEVPRQSIEPGARRGSGDSTCAQGGSRGGSRAVSPDRAEATFYEHQNYGLPPSSVRSGQHVERIQDDDDADAEAEVTEIHLDPQPLEDEREGAAAPQHQEMVETQHPHAPFVPGLQQHVREGDARMEDAAQNGDGGVGAYRQQ